MFGFGSNDKKKDEVKRTVEVKKQEEDINWVWVENTLGNTFGLTNIDRVYKMYMPELSEAILTAKDYSVANNKNQIDIGNFIKKSLKLWNSRMLRCSAKTRNYRKSTMPWWRGWRGILRWRMGKGGDGNVGL